MSETVSDLTESSLVLPDFEHEGSPEQGANYLAAGKVAVIGSRLVSYDSNSPEAVHLRPHQVEAVQEFQQTAKSIVDGRIANRGMAILHPTGSGKTVTTAEIARMFCGKMDDKTDPLKVLMLVPGHQILRQTTGDEDELGAIRTFAGNVSVSEYSGRRKGRNSLVTVMTYHSLPWALERGDIDAIDPSLIVCDQAHHIIDGTWADAVEEIAADRLLLGLTATPLYSDSRNINRLFPNILAQKSMKEGIEEGMLAEMQGFLYKGSSRIEVTGRRGVDYTDTDLFESIANSDDNYLAAKICAREVEFGRRGVVSCVAGFDRAHAKIMAEILSNTTVNTPDGERKIRAAFIGGDLHEQEQERILRDYKNGDLDVLTYVSMLLEGWDSPESDFTVLLRPTMSRVLAEQRIGRIIRPRPGKVATVHEIMYKIDGDDASGQITHMDILDRSTVSQGYTYGPKANKKNGRRDSGLGQESYFSIDDYKVDPDLAEKISELDAIPLEEVRVLCGQESLPYDWHTSHILASKFDISREQVEKILSESDIEGRHEEGEDLVRVFYPPRASRIIAEHIGLRMLPEDAITLGELVRHHREFKQFGKVSRRAVESALDESGVVAELFLTEDGRVVRAYPDSSKEIAPSMPTGNSERVRKEDKPLDNSPEAVLSWLDGILVNPGDAFTEFRKREILTGQNTLLNCINKMSGVDGGLYNELKEKVSELSMEPTAQMQNVMNAKKLDFIGLMIAAINARSTIRAMETHKSKGNKKSGVWV